MDVATIEVWSAGFPYLRFRMQCFDSFPNRQVIAAAMMMAITAMPAMAGNKHHKNHDKKTTVVVVTNNHKASHFDKVDITVCHTIYIHKKSRLARLQVGTLTYAVNQSPL